MQLEQLIKSIKKGKFNIAHFGLTLLAIIVVRTFFEHILESRHLVATVDNFYDNSVEYLHVIFSWISLFLSATYILNLFDKDSIANTLKITLASFGVIIIVPFLDYFMFGSGQILYETNFQDFWFKYFYLFDVTKEIPKVTNGVRVEIFLVFLMSFVYIYVTTKSLLKALIASVLVYTLIYFYGYLPAVVNTLLDTHYMALVHKSVLPIQSLINLNFYTYLPILSLLFILYFFKIEKQYRYMILDALRIERLSIYVGIFLFAFFVSAKYGMVDDAIYNTYDMLKLYSGLLALIFSFVYASMLNNMSDIDIDIESNPQRALIRYRISSDVYTQTKNITLFFAFSTALAVNESFVFIVIAILALSYIYSMSPLRLRRFLLVSNFILSVIAVLVFLLGVCVIEGSAAFLQLHKEYVVAVFLVYFLASHLKDIKDAESDQKYGVTTLATLFPVKKLLWIIKFFVMVAIVAVCILFHFSFLITILFMLVYILGMLFIRNSEYFLVFLQLLVTIVYCYQYINI